MNDIETLLRDALDARASLVQPEHLTPEAPFPTAASNPWWRQPRTLLAVAAVAVIVIAIPLLALVVTRGDDSKEPGPAQSPTTETPRTSWTGDVDGDGAADDIRVAGRSVLVALSESGTTVAHGLDATAPTVVESTDVDGRAGAEVIVVDYTRGSDPRGYPPMVLSLRDGELVEILDHEFDTAGEGLPEGSYTYFWVDAGNLRWWQTQEPPANGVEYYVVDSVFFQHGDEVLEAEDVGEWCVPVTEPTELTDCGEFTKPWWERGGDQGAWNEPQTTPMPGRLEGDVNDDGFLDEVWLEGAGGAVELRVRLDFKEGESQELEMPVSGAGLLLGPLVSVAGSPQYLIPVVENVGAAGTSYSRWQMYMVRDGELVRLEVPDEPFLGQQLSNLSVADGGRDTWRTWVHPETGELYTMSFDEGTSITDEGYPGDGTIRYRNAIYHWRIDGTRLRAEVVGEGCTVDGGDTTIYGCP